MAFSGHATSYFLSNTRFLYLTTVSAAAFHACLSTSFFLQVKKEAKTPQPGTNNMTNYLPKILVAAERKRPKVVTNFKYFRLVLANDSSILSQQLISSRFFMLESATSCGPAGLSCSIQDPSSEI